MVMTKTKGEIFSERVTAEAKEFAKEHLADVKDFMPQDEYLETVEVFTNVFIAGANCARDVLQDIVKEVKEGKL